MALAKKAAPSGAPEWVLTYGDMMSLLLCFFILLAAFADYSANGSQPTPELEQALASIREAFGAGGSAASNHEIDFQELIRKLKAMASKPTSGHRGDTYEEGIYGKNFRLRKIRDGMEITMGGPVVFEPFSDKLTLEGKQALEQIAETVRGHRNKMEIRGHAAEEPRPADWTDDDALLLSFRRAKVVADELILRGVDRRALVCSAVGANEPLATGVYDVNRRAQARRVEIIVRESMIDDYVKPASEEDARAQMPSTTPASIPSTTLIAPMGQDLP
jgi:chemotaxis protein MotB